MYWLHPGVRPVLLWNMEAHFEVFQSVVKPVYIMCIVLVMQYLMPPGLIDCAV